MLSEFERQEELKAQKAYQTIRRSNEWKEGTPGRKLIKAVFGEDAWGINEDAVWQVVKNLPEREERVLELRFGRIPRGNCRSLEEVGEEFGVTRERIRQVEARALRKLRAPSNADLLKKAIIRLEEPAMTEIMRLSNAKAIYIEGKSITRDEAHEIIIKLTETWGMPLIEVIS